MRTKERARTESVRPLWDLSSAVTGHDELRGRADPPQFCPRPESSPAQERARRAGDGRVLRQLRLPPTECSERAKASGIRPR